MMNPVLGREVKERMRGPRAFVAITVYLSVLLLVLWAVHTAARPQSIGFGSVLGDQTTLGRKVFDWLLFVMLLLVMFLVPALTAGAVTGERERQTLVPLQVTLLSPRQIMWGKVTSSLAFVGVLVVVAAPLLAVGYSIGGISVAQAARGVLAVLVVGLLLGTMVVGISARLRRVQSATVVAFALAFLLSVGSFLAYGAAAVIDASRGTDETNPPAWLLAPNPFVFVAEVVDLGEGGPLGGLHRALEDARDRQSSSQVDFGGPIPPGVAIASGSSSGSGIAVNSAAGSDVTIVNGPVVVAGPAPLPANAPPGLFAAQRPPSRYPFWPISLASMVLLAALLFWAGSRRLRTPAESER
jgi:ABC-type transport system involved in multi-copper enzyme maturation permease subunit